jgi:hypothetical protein
MPAYCGRHQASTKKDSPVLGSKHIPAPIDETESSAASMVVGLGSCQSLLDRFYLGPEAQIYSTDSYLHKRVGVHLTALKIDEREWSGAVGLASDNDNRSGVYVRINVLTRR